MKVCEKIYSKYNRLQEVTSSVYIKKIKKILLSYANGDDTYDQLKNKLINLAWNTNSETGVISDTPEIADLNTKIINYNAIEDMLIYACNTLSNDQKIIMKAKSVLSRMNGDIIKSFVHAMQYGNERTLQGKFDYEGYQKGARIENL